MKFGKAFSDSVITEWKKERLFETKKDSWWLGTGRVLFFATLAIIVLFILLFRLFSLTVISGHTYKLLSDENRTRELVSHAKRGEILDRTGKVLAYSIPYYKLSRPCVNDVNTLCVSQISKADGDAMKTKGLSDGEFLEEDYEREYMIPEAIAHVIGYIGEISQKELADSYYILRNYHTGDKLGRSGVESAFESKLKGRDGRKLLEVDAQGKTLRVLGEEPSIPGEDVILSLDKGLAETVQKAFPTGKKGAVVVSNPKTGEILALFSSPTYSPSAFTSGAQSSLYSSYLDNPDKPLFDRAIGGVYPPGSTFKLVTALAALEEKSVKKTTLIEDTGEIKIGPYTFPNWYFKQYGKTDGMVDVVKALQRSNDIFFYKAGELLGITKLADWARRVGVGKPLGIELSGEAGGLMPDPKWKNEQFTTDEDIRLKNNEWYTGDTYHVAIGQGYLLTTPLQVNTWTNVIADGGKLCRPTIQKTGDNKHKTENCKDLGIKMETIDVITEGMRRACDEGGTGYPLFGFGIRKLKLEDLPAGRQVEQQIATTSGEFTRIPVACKTGTAEFGLSVGSGNLQTHAWFTAFAPLPTTPSSGTGQALSSGKIISGEPELSVTVLLEGEGEGSDKAAPIAKKILEEWFSR